jgi:hypothetical protein
MAVVQRGTGVEFDFYEAQSPNRLPRSSVYYSTPCPTVNEWTAATVVNDVLSHIRVLAWQ